MRYLVVVVLLLSISSIQIGYCYEDKPLFMRPCNLVEQLPEPVKSLHITLAESLHTEQTRLIEKEDGSTDTILVILALALEEYYHRELSYPGSCVDLCSSGYLDPEWEKLDYSIIDFNDLNENSNASKTIIYIPQPIGLTKLSPVPGRRCAFTRFCYSEYVLAVESGFQPGGSKMSDPDWFTPYSSLGLESVCYINQSNPGASECAGCAY